MDDELGARLGEFPLWHGVGLVISMVIFGMGLLGLQDPEIYCCTAVSTILSLAIAVPSLRLIFVAVHEKGLYIRYLVRKRTIPWTEIAEVGVDHRLEPYYIIGQRGLLAPIDFMFAEAVLVIWYVWTTLEIFIPSPVSRYTFTLRDGKVIKIQGDRSLVNLEPMVAHHLAQLSDGTIYTTRRMFRIIRLYQPLDASRKQAGK